MWVGKKATDKERDEAMKYSTVSFSAIPSALSWLNLPCMTCCNRCKHEYFLLIQEFIKQQNYDDRKVAVARVVEGAEPFEFKALFGDQWR